MINFIIGNKYRLLKKNGKGKKIKLDYIDYNEHLLYFTFNKLSIMGKNPKEIKIRYINEKYFLNDKDVEIVDIIPLTSDSIIEQYNYINNLSDDIKGSIIEYTTNKYIKINNYLEKNQIPYDKSLTDIIDNIDIAFKNAPPLKENIVLFRGLNLPDIYDSRRKLNIKLATYKGMYKGFLSTSLKIYNTEMFQNKTCCTFEINVPKKSKCLFIEFISNVATEQEVLIPRNSILAITSFTETNIIKADLKQNENNII